MAFLPHITGFARGFVRDLRTCRALAEVGVFRSGPIVLRIAGRAGRLIPNNASERSRAIQWLAAALNTVDAPVVAFGIGDRLEADRSCSAERLTVVVGSIETRLTSLQAWPGDGLWLEGKVFTIGNRIMVSVPGGLRGTGLLDRFPGIAAYVVCGEGRPSRRNAMTDHLAVFKQPAAA